MSTIPASELVSVTPGVLGIGGSAVDIIGLILTTNTRVPIGTVQRFASADEVGSFFGLGSAEAIAAGGGAGMGSGYFGGFTNANKIPASVLFAQYNTAAVAAYLRGGDVSGTTLAALQALSGSLAVVFDGVSRSAASINLSSATSFSSAAGIIQTGLNAAAPAAASVTGSIGGVITASAGATFTGSGSGTNLTTTSVTGVIHIGAKITGTGVPANTQIVSQTSGTTGGAGVYVTNNSTTSSSNALVASSNVMDVTAVASGTLQPTDAISGTGVSASTTILAQLSGTAGSTGTYTISSQQQFASATVTSLSTVLNVTAVGSGSISVGNPISGTNVTSGSVISALGTGVGGVGTYVVSHASTTISETITVTATNVVVTYDSTSGAFVVTSGITGATSSAAFATGTLSASLMLTSATGAILSQGAAAAVPGTFMDGLVEVDSSWATFMTLFDPDVSGNTNKAAFAAWNSAQNNAYAYVCWDTDITPTASVPATGSLGYILANNSDSGTALIYEATDLNLAAFVCGAAAAIDFTEKNGRISFAYKTQAGLEPSVTDPTVATNLGGNPQTSDRGNGYNFYGAYAQANENFVWFQRGFVTGAFLWLDSYINQIWLNRSFQTALLNLQANARSIPYNAAGQTMIESALADPIAAGLNFGAFSPGTISASQIAAVNAAAGRNISTTLQTQGWYLLVGDASSSSRAARTTPPAKFFYLDRGSVQAINLASIALQ